MIPDYDVVADAASVIEQKIANDRIARTQSWEDHRAMIKRRMEQAMADFRTATDGMTIEELRAYAKAQGLMPYLPAWWVRDHPEDVD